MMDRRISEHLTQKYGLCCNLYDEGKAKGKKGKSISMMVAPLLRMKMRACKQACKSEHANISFQ